MFGAGPIQKDEPLGRSISSSKAAKRVKNRRRGLFKEFLPTGGTLDVSVDRLDAYERLFAHQVARNRYSGSGRKFYGWAAIDADVAQLDNLRIEESPTIDNPIHADIVFPAVCISNVDMQAEYAQLLAELSRWEPGPEGEGI